VQFDEAAGKPTAGCFEISKLDLDPDRVGIQADCQVSEVKISKGADGKEVEGASRPITNRCKDELVELLEKTESGGKVGHVATHETPKPAEEAQGQQFPCWRPSFQPFVCLDA